MIHMDSRLGVMIHLADIAAYIIREHYLVDPIFQAWCEAVRVRLDADPAALRP